MSNRTFPSAAPTSGIPNDEELAREEEAAYEFDPVEEAESQEEKELRNTLAQYMGDSGAKIYLYDMNEKGKNGSGVFIEKLVANEHTHDEIMERLRDEHGGGDFKVQIRNKQGHIQANQQVSTVKKPVVEEKDNSDNVAEIIRAVKEGADEKSNMLMMMMTQQQTQSDNNMQMMMAQMKSQNDMMIAMMTAQNNQPQQQPMGLPEIVTLMASLKELNGNEPKTDPMDMMFKGIELAREMNAGGGDENVLQTAIKSLGAPLVNAAEQMAKLQNNQQHMQFGAVPRSTTQPQPTSIETEQENNEMGIMQKMKLMAELQPHIEALYQGASTGSPTEGYAQQIVEKVPRETIAQFMIPDEMYEQLFVHIPDFVQYRPWFDLLREQTLSLLKNPNQSAGNEIETTKTNETGTVIEANQFDEQFRSTDFSGEPVPNGEHDTDQSTTV